MCYEITAGELQELFATLYGAEEGVFWDFYTIADKQLLKKKLEFLIPDLKAVQLENEPLNPLSEDEKQKKIAELVEINEKLVAARAKLLDVLWAQRKYNNGDLIMSIIFVLVTPEQGNYTTYSLKKQKTFSCHPVFRVRKCKVEEESEKCCAVFVDEIARVYQNWGDFLNNNRLPEGIMLAPQSGYYKFDSSNKVCLTTQTTPEASLERKILKGVDIASQIVQGGLLLNAFLPRNRGLTIGSLVFGLGAGGWSLGRSIYELVDRDNHEESLSLAIPEARAAWGDLAQNILGIGATSASQGQILAALDGRNVRAAKIAATCFNTATYAMAGVKTVDSIITQILEKRNYETGEIKQFKTSLVIFTHSFYNFKLISELEIHGGTSTMQEFRRILTDAQRKIYSDLVSIKYSGDIIRQPGIIPWDESINFGKNAKRLAEKYLQIIRNNQFLTNPQDFQFCIMEMLKKLNETAIDTLFNIAKSFLDPATRSNLSVSSIPFEHVFWRLYIIVNTINSNQLEVVGKNRKQRRAILAELKKVYKNKNEDNITCCNTCGGYYSIVAVA